MILQTYSLEVITPCFCGGAEPDQRAEIRPASIRGQLRWWFRVLGGFKSLPHQSVEEQEAMIFGSTAGDDGTAGMLTVRVKCNSISRDYPAPGMQSPEGYFLFPLRNNPRHQIPAGQLFELQFLWRGGPSLAGDLSALASVFGNLGSLGFRSRRAMGALFLRSGMGLALALNRFNNSAQAIHVAEIQGNFQPQNQIPAEARAIAGLANWLKDWRSHGRTVDHAWATTPNPPYNSGFTYAKNDHDIGYNMPQTAQSPAFRPALGLPIIQRTQRGANQWNQRQNASGRFASPVILRPHKDAQGHWHALVIFVEAKKWPQGQRVYLNGQPRAVSLDLYDAMKHDKRLQPFP
jgi:CRISPR-associated protein Cmr1